MPIGNRKFALFNISEQSSLLGETDEKPLAGVISPVSATKYKVHVALEIHINAM